MPELPDSKKPIESKVYDFKCLGEDVKRFLESTVRHVETLSTLLESEINTDSYIKLFHQVSFLLASMIERKQLINLQGDEIDRFIEKMKTSERPIIDSDLSKQEIEKVEERYAELAELAQKLLNRLKVTPRELEFRRAETDEFQDMALGSGLSEIVKTVGSTLKGALAKIPKLGKPRDPSQDN